MPFRLTGKLDSKLVDLIVGREPLILGSSTSCDLCLNHSTVSRQHAELREVDGGLEISDLGSKNGTHVGRRRISSVVVGDGAKVRFGAIGLTVERLAEADRDVAMLLDVDPSQEDVSGPLHGVTDSRSPLEALVREVVPRLLELVAHELDLTRAAQLVGQGIYDLLPVCELSIRRSRNGRKGVLYSARDATQGRSGPPMVIEEGDIEVSVSFFTSDECGQGTTLIEAACLLLSRISTLEASAPHVRHDAPGLPEPATVDPGLRRIYEEASQIARSDVGVLICGESGTGKEILARYLHQASPRADGPFVTVNCAALPRDLLEAELFGIERGVATGVDRREGRFELADGGTLFLDEIGDMAFETQAMILRSVQEGEVFRIGAARPRKVSVRIVAATNKDIVRLMEVGRFRQDLYFRIATWKTEAPPLRRRSADIPNLAAYFLARNARQLGKRVLGISRAALDALVAYNWPGNVRQLENEMARAAAFLADGTILDSRYLSPEVLAGPAADPGETLQARLEAAERIEIVAALAQSEGDTVAAAEQLGISRPTLYRRMRALGVAPPKVRHERS